MKITLMTLSFLLCALLLHVLPAAGSYAFVERDEKICKRHTGHTTCKTSALGKEYIGTLSTTKSGKTCQAWTSKATHDHGTFTDGQFPDSSVVAASNYCRNPDGTVGGPWCYTTDKATRWEYCQIPYCGASKCKLTALGTEYIGTVSTTRSGKTCQAWTSKATHSHGTFTDSQFPDRSVDAASNYCRNPDGTVGGPWCYTTDPATRWEYCYIPTCGSTRCKTTGVGTEYRGTLSTTKSGKTCQAWTSKATHSHPTFTDSQFPDRSIDAASNYCRNPDRSAQGIWCYTTDPATRWEACDIKYCGATKCRLTALGTEYAGTVSKTKSGKTCQAWTSKATHSHPTFTDSQFPDRNIEAASNYCRNPDSTAQGIWCYTTDPATRWEACDVPLCGEVDVLVS